MRKVIDHKATFTDQRYLTRNFSIFRSLYVYFILPFTDVQNFSERK